MRWKEPEAGKPPETIGAVTPLKFHRRRSDASRKLRLQESVQQILQVMNTSAWRYSVENKNGILHHWCLGNQISSVSYYVEKQWKLSKLMNKFTLTRKFHLKNINLQMFT